MPTETPASAQPPFGAGALGNYKKKNRNDVSLSTVRRLGHISPLRIERKWSKKRRGREEKTVEVSR